MNNKYISFVLFPQVSQPSMNFKISKKIDLKDGIKWKGEQRGGRGRKSPIIISSFFCSLAFEHTAAKWGLGVWGPSRGEISRLLGYHLRWSLDNAWSKCCLQVTRLWYSGNGNHECVLRKRHGKGNVILCALLYFICYYVMVVVCYLNLSVASVFYGWIVLSTVVKDKGIVLYPLDRTFSSGALLVLGMVGRFGWYHGRSQPGGIPPEVGHQVTPTQFSISLQPAWGFLIRAGANSSWLGFKNKMNDVSYGIG